jgi:ATP-dependent exoDNAse (exonuclease V) beta subunit
MACDDEVIPLQERIEAIGDEADLREVYETERHLLYVACSRARDRLLVAKRSSIISGSGPRLWRPRSAPLRSAEWFAVNALLGQIGVGHRDPRPV